MSIANSKPPRNIPLLVKSGIFRLVKMGIFAALGVVALLPAACQSVHRDYTRAFPPQPNQIAPMTGRWVDLEEAANQAMSEIGMRPTAVDRWQSAVRFEIVTEKGRSGELLVLGNRETGIKRAEARIGRFGDPEREAELLGALQYWLGELSDRPRLTGAR